MSKPTNTTSKLSIRLPIRGGITITAERICADCGGDHGLFRAIPSGPLIPACDSCGSLLFFRAVTFTR